MNKQLTQKQMSNFIELFHSCKKFFFDFLYLYNFRLRVTHEKLFHSQIKYLREARRICESVWAQFNIHSIMLGILILIISILLIGIEYCMNFDAFFSLY